MKALISTSVKAFAVIAWCLCMTTEANAQFTLGVDKGVNWKFNNAEKSTNNGEITNMFFGMTGVRGEIHWGARVVFGHGSYSFEGDVRPGTFKTKGMNFEAGWIQKTDHLISPMITGALGAPFFNYDGWKLDGAYGMEAGAGVFIGKYAYSIEKGTWRRTGLTVQAMYQSWSSTVMDYKGPSIRVGFRMYLDGGYEN